MTAPPGKHRSSEGAAWAEGSGPVLILAGPTASGKSGLAAALAEAVDGVVINADSMQVYRELCVLSARPDAAALARAPHRLYGVLPAADACSAGRWRQMARGAVAEAHLQGRLPILAGGTGLYLKAFLSGLAYLPEIPSEIRDATRALHERLGAAAFHAALAARDPVMARRLQPGDRQRLMRAWEVLEATGRSLADWQSQSEPRRDGFAILPLVLLPPRAALYAACDARVHAMIAAGAVEEVRALRSLALDSALPAMKAVGVRELGGYLDGDWDLDQAIAAMQQATRNYAKRQMTWLRHQMPKAGPAAAGQILPQETIQGLLDAQLLESLCARMFTFIRQFC